MVFEGEPFYELWTDDDFEQEFSDFIKNGQIFGIYLDDSICGLITIKKNYLKWDKLDIDVERAIYLSDIAVCRSSRNNGYGTRLMKYIVSEFGDKYDIYMRTNLENSMSEGIALRNDFEVIEGKIQEVTFKRTRTDIPEVDKRKYLIRKRKEG